jgi:putative salt-induced outer membrane protein YdiY
VTATRDGVVTVETGFAGTLKILQEQIAAMRTRKPVVMKLQDGVVLQDQPILVEDGELQVPGASGKEEGYSLAELLVVNPEPWELGQGYKWSGLASTAFSVKQGNSDIEELDYRIENTWRSLGNRFTLKVFGETDESNGVKNAENWSVTGKYDAFVDGPWYPGARAAAESDRFADLNLRYYLGPYFGRQIAESSLLNLSAEMGAVYVQEDFIVADDKDYPGLNWTASATSGVLGGDSRLYLDHNGILNLDDATDLIMNTSLGMAFPLMFNVEAAAELLLQYDSGVPPGVEEMDQTYRFRIGYLW